MAVAAFVGPGSRAALMKRGTAVAAFAETTKPWHLLQQQSTMDSLF
jgi:hypothetical protein